MAAALASMSRRLILALALAATIPASLGFQSTAIVFDGLGKLPLSSSKSTRVLPTRSLQQTRMMARGKKSADFDLLDGKDFDLLALRSFRREARIKYSNLNQSEPLRIYLSALIFFFAASYPKIAEALQDPITDMQRIQCVAIALPAFAAFLRERGRRTAQLTRMDKECAIGDLELSAVDAMTGARQTFSVRDLRNKRRLIAYYGNKEYLKKALGEAAVYRRRYMTSKVAVLAVSTDGSTRDDWQLPEGATGPQGAWLWGPSKQPEWIDYFETLLDGKLSESEESGSWIALNDKGRSCASGLGLPIIDELLGSKMPPINIMSEEDSYIGSEDEGVKSLLEAQASFYQCLTEVILPTSPGGAQCGLTEGKVDEMMGLWGSAEDAGVTEFIGLGGRLDPWSNQLKDGARPEGMTINSRDALLLSDVEAITTCIEVPSTGMGQTLLATQKWTKAEGGQWELAGHKTIPYSVNSGALAVLRCDGRGCVCGLREKDRANRNPLILPQP